MRVLAFLSSLASQASFAPVRHGSQMQAAALQPNLRSASDAEDNAKLLGMLKRQDALPG